MQDPLNHDHSFGQERPKAGERKTLAVIFLTAAMMTVEIVGGLLFGSMAVLADGLHMASHASTLMISLFAYRFARRNANSARFNFGTGKVNALAAFASATLLVSFAFYMALQSVLRLFSPVPILFSQAIAVAVAGLVVNLVCLLVLKDDHRGHDHDHGHHHAHESADLNRHSAYIHVLADALTSVFAIAAILIAKWTGFHQVDPIMGLVGAALVARWAWQLIRASNEILLDMRVEPSIFEKVRSRLEEWGGCQVADLHLWTIAPGILAGTITVVARAPELASHYRSLLPGDIGLQHVTIEVHREKCV